MKNTHTGGDWYVERIHTMADKTPHDYDIWAVYSTRRTRYADKPQDICFFNWRTPEGKANAHLIASAPDLLSALEWALGQIEDDLCQDHQAALDGCRADIAKSKGEA